MSDTPTDDTSHYEGALLEDINDKLQSIAEAVGGLTESVNDIRQRVVRIEQKTDLIVPMQTAIAEQSADLDNHERRITRLERKAA